MQPTVINGEFTTSAVHPATSAPDQGAVALHTGATVNGVQTQADVLMRRHNPEGWPSAIAGLSTWESLAISLDARDMAVDLKALTMNPHTGGLYNRRKAGPEHGGVIPTHTALGHFVGLSGEAPNRATENLEFYPPAVRAQMFAHLVSKADDRQVVMRTARLGGGAFVVRAVTSAKHSQAHGDDLALISQLRRLPDYVLGSAKMRVVKEWDYTHVEMVLPAKVREVKPGIVIQGRINLTNSETKGGSFEASVGTLNLVCLNGMVGAGNRSTMSVKHVGDIRSRMRASVVTVVDLVDVYLEEFAQAYAQPLPGTRAEAIERTVRRFRLPESTGAALATLWDVDGARGAGDTVAGLANALTRHAQSQPVEAALATEAVAGQVLAGGIDALL